METLRQTTPEQHSSVPARPIDVAGPPARTRYVDAVVDDYLDASDSEGLLEYWRVLWRHKATIWGIHLTQVTPTSCGWLTGPQRPSRRRSIDTALGPRRLPAAQGGRRVFPGCVSCAG